MGSLSLFKIQIALIIPIEFLIIDFNVSVRNLMVRYKKSYQNYNFTVFEKIKSGIKNRNIYCSTAVLFWKILNDQLEACVQIHLEIMLA